MELLRLVPNDVGTKLPVRAVHIPVPAELLRQVQDNGRGEAVVLPSEGHEGLARLGLHVGGIHNDQLPGGEAFGGDEVQRVKGVVGRRLGVLIVRDQAPEEV